MMQTGLLERARVQNVPRLFLEPIETVKAYERRKPKRRMPRKPETVRDPVVALQGVAELYDAMKGGAAARAKAERRHAERDRTITFVLYWVMAALLVGAVWAGAHG